MKINKRVLAKLEMVYAVSPIRLDEKLHFLGATEEHGKCLLFSPPDWTPSVVWEGPGGTMSLIPVPNRKGFLAIQEFFPIFQSEKACVVFAEPGEDVKKPWRVTRVVDLPFAHRIDLVNVGNTPCVIAASLCAGKNFRDDWSQPGAVYAVPLPEDREGGWRAEPILGGISKNHGMHVVTSDGRRLVLITGQEGLFAIKVPALRGELWSSEFWLTHEISDVFAHDLDGDGCVELVTIEPFHGNKLVVYKWGDRKWSAVCEWKIDFGHALWAGDMLGAPAILVGNRGGEKELLMLRLKSGHRTTLACEVIDRGVGPAQVTVFHDLGYPAILSANHGVGEVALYEVSD